MKRKGFLLPVEDDPARAEPAGRALLESGVGLETIIAYDGRQALDYLLAEGAYRGRDASVLPELILVDVKLPELDGFQVLQRIREHHAVRYIPVLILSCRDQEHDIATSYALGANGYLRKPVDFRQFVEAERAPGAAFPSVGEALSDHGKDLKHVGGAAGSKN